MRSNKKNKYIKGFFPFNSTKSQVILGFIFAFMVTMLLALGIVRIWTWFNANYAHRELAYQRSRLRAGKPTEYVDSKDTSVLSAWFMFSNYPDSRTRPEWMEWVKKQTLIDIGGEDVGEDTGDPTKKYKPLNLTEEWVFEGIVREGVSLYGIAGMTPEEMAKQCDEECSTEEGCLSTYLDETTVDRTCPCFVKCMCFLATKQDADFMIAQAQRLEGQASQLRSSADSLRDQAESCDDPWEVCWWGDWGATKSELRSAASQLDSQAALMDVDAAAMRAKAVTLQACCNLETQALQDVCTQEAVKEAGCERYCFVECAYQCNYFSGKNGYYESCYNGCNGPCYNICTEAGSTCENLINNQISVIDSYIVSLEAEKQKIQSGINSVETNISNCQTWSHDYCDMKCEDEADYQTCYDECRPPQLQDCCESVCCLESGNTINCQPSGCRLSATCDEALSASCTTSCTSSCIVGEDANGNPIRDDLCFTDCFSGCYTEEALASCYTMDDFDPDSWMLMAFGIFGQFSFGCPCGAYERDCYEPVNFCDEDCYGQTNCPRCGLQEIINRFNERIAEIDAEIADLNQRKDDLGGCCSVSYPLLEGQMDCIKEIMGRE